MRFTTQRGSPWFVPRDVLELDKVSIRGVVYASTKSLPRDSNVIFRKPGDSTLRAGKIDVIFSSPYPGADYEEKKVTCLVIQEWLPVKEVASQKTYREFGFAGGFLCHNNFVGAVSILGVDNVVCHFAKTFLEKRDGDIFHVLPLNKVGLKITLYPCRLSNPSFPLRCSTHTRSRWTGTFTRSINASINGLACFVGIVWKHSSKKSDVCLPRKHTLFQSENETTTTGELCRAYNKSLRTERNTKVNEKRQCWEKGAV